ncbi:hypothetical protein BaRGS_00040166 [Batillaria attramentaria]|uniref:Uncharacterized protein n=1 Tax=Batillaria attramentaria TaxID=370345 RepID=A0ABD0J126_9CAEN
MILFTAPLHGQLWHKSTALYSRQVVCNGCLPGPARAPRTPQATGKSCYHTPHIPTVQVNTSSPRQWAESVQQCACVTVSGHRLKNKICVVMA